MKKAFPLLAIFALALLAFSQGTQQVNVTGDWELTTTSQRGGERTQTITLKQEGEKLTVTMTGRQGEEMKAEGTVKGNDIEWSITRSTPRGEFTITYKGKIEGDTMSGQVQMGDFGSSDWKAARKK
jgi:D-glucosaminate-6-phosphate ammonia-lyase